MRSSRRSGVYTITCAVNQGVYVGSSRHIPQRKAAHYHQLRNGKHHCKQLQEDFAAYGEAAFKFRAFYFPLNDIRLEEQKGIAYYREAGLCYNTGNVVNVEVRRAAPIRDKPKPRRRGVPPRLLQKWQEEREEKRRARERFYAKLRMQRYL